MTLELVIFDCDGVLVDSEPLACAVLAEDLAPLGLDLGADEVRRRFRGLRLSEVLARIEQQLGRELPPGFLERLQRRTFEVLRREVRPMPGVIEALEAIRIPVCVASSGEPEKMRLTLGATGLLERFEGRIFSAVEVARGKPHPDLFLHAAARLGAAPARSIVVEDSVPGVEAGRRAGMPVLGYAPGGDGRELELAGARVFEDMALLPGLIEATARGGTA